jgi:hypothetical protein
VENGIGVYGLRRARVLAGSETQGMSLWQVSDAGTRDLMSAYYTNLKSGEGRTEAMRQVQLAMLHGQTSATTSSGKRETSDTGDKEVTRDYRHPYYWAAFISSGDWRNIRDLAVVPRNEGRSSIDLFETLSHIRALEFRYPRVLPDEYKISAVELNRCAVGFNVRFQCPRVTPGSNALLIALRIDIPV